MIYSFNNHKEITTIKLFYDGYDINSIQPNEINTYKYIINKKYDRLNYMSAY